MSSVSNPPKPGHEKVAIHGEHHHICRLAAQLNVMAETARYAELKQIIKSLSLKRGHFTLSSGQQSSFYLDCRMTTLSARGSSLIGEMLYELMAPLHIDAVGGMTLGADPIVTAVSLTSTRHGDAINGFLVRKETKAHGTGKTVEGHIGPWMRVVLVEDVVTTGESTLNAIQAVKKISPSIEIAHVIALVDRKQGAAEAFSQAGIPFLALYDIDAILQE
ncbi:MAG: orotate phosphoribosyltransferase [Candidatus Melainabacteria bacterium]